MRVVVDADSMNARLREVIAAAADRRGFRALFVANRPLALPDSRRAKLLIARDVDERIVRLVAPDDIVVTRDVPLAARLVERGVTALNDRGGVFTRETIDERLSRRDEAKRLRDAGLLFERGRTFGRAEVKAFSDAFDRELTRRGVPVGLPRVGDAAADIAKGEQKG